MQRGFNALSSIVHNAYLSQINDRVVLDTVPDAKAVISDTIKADKPAATGNTVKMPDSGANPSASAPITPASEVKINNERTWQSLVHKRLSMNKNFLTLLAITAVAPFAIAAAPLEQFRSVTSVQQQSAQLAATTNAKITTMSEQINGALATQSSALANAIRGGRRARGC